MRWLWRSDLSFGATSDFHNDFSKSQCDQPRGERELQSSFLDSYESVHSFDHSQISASQDQFTFPFPTQYPVFSGYRSFTSPMLPPQLTPQAHTLAEQHPSSVQSDQDRFRPLLTHDYFDVGLPEADWDFTLPSQPPMNFDFG